MRRQPIQYSVLARDVFEAEVDAYELAQKTPEIKPLVAEGYRKLDNCVSVVDGKGNDVSERFLCDCAIAMDYLDGEFVDKTYVSSDEYKRVYTLFHNAGIKYIVDAAFILDDGKVVKLVDFSTREFELFHPELPDPFL